MDFEERTEKRVKDVLQRHYRTRHVTWEDVRDIVLTRAKRLTRPRSTKAREDLKAYLELAQPSEWFKRMAEDDRKRGRYGIELDLIGEVKWRDTTDTLDISFIVPGAGYPQWETLGSEFTLPWRKAWGDPSPKKECLIDEGESVFLITQVSAKPQSLFSLWDHWRKRISPDHLRSKEWMDQIMVSYAIKRAQKGDKDARNRLCACYRDRVSSLVKGFCSAKEISLEDWGDVDATAQLLLMLLIAGDTPASLLDLLESWLEAGAEKDWIPNDWASTAILKASLYWIELLLAIEAREAQLVYQFTSPEMATFQEVLRYRIERGLEETIDKLDSWQLGEDSSRLQDDPVYQLDEILSESAEMIHSANLLRDDPIAGRACYDLRKPGTLTTYLLGSKGSKTEAGRRGALWNRLLNWHTQFYLPRQREVPPEKAPRPIREEYFGDLYEN